MPWLIDAFNKLSPTQELAFQSNLCINDQVFHIPMIDFGGKDRELKTFFELESFVELWEMDFLIYSTGRSYHAYGNRLIDHETWIKFMGSLLLINRR